MDNRSEACQASYARYIAVRGCDFWSKRQKAQRSQGWNVGRHKTRVAVSDCPRSCTVRLAAVSLIGERQQGLMNSMINVDVITDQRGRCQRSRVDVRLVAHASVFFCVCPRTEPRQTRSDAARRGDRNCRQQTRRR